MWESGEAAESGHCCVCSWLGHDVFFLGLRLRHKIFFRYLWERTCSVVVTRNWALGFVHDACVRRNVAKTSALALAVDHPFSTFLQ